MTRLHSLSPYTRVLVPSTPSAPSGISDRKRPAGRNRAAHGNCTANGLGRPRLVAHVSAAVVLGLLLALGPTSVTAWADDLPEGVVNTQNPEHRSLSPEESLARITVPEGFHVTLFAGEPDIRRPIAFDFDDRGRLWVVENYSHPKWDEDSATDRVIILEDADHDGRFDKRTVFWDKGRYLTGIAVGSSGIWLANTPELIFIADRNRDDVPDSQPEVVLDGFQKSTNNVLNNLHWGPDGWLYGAIGLSSKSLIAAPGTTSPASRTPITRGIWRYHPISGAFEKVAEGMVNPWGADFNEYGDLMTSNTVLAHLWHIVPGMYCERRASENDNPFAYGRIQTIANHLHWGGGAWNDSRNPSSRKQKNTSANGTSENITTEQDDDYHAHSVAGGGHAHCGGMVYLGDNWPENYRGSFFTNNLHGNRVNHDRLVPKRSSYVATHADDFLFGNDPWFRGMSVKYGPDGGVWVSDWHDFGECHDSDGSHRTSGRIYKVVYGTPSSRTFDLHDRTNAELVSLTLHRNAWFPRHARRILSERTMAAPDQQKEVSRLLWQIFDEEPDVHIRLRALWTIYSIQQLSFSRNLELLTHENEHIRRWAVRLLVDDQPSDMSSPTAQKQRTRSSVLSQHLTNVAASETSAKVRLALAASLQRLDPQHRLPLAAQLVKNEADVTDPYIPLMIWYGLEPAVMQDKSAALNVAERAAIPQIRRFVARRIADNERPDLDAIVNSAFRAGDESKCRDLLQGMHAALVGRGSTAAPESWSRLYSRVSAAGDSELRGTAVQLATIFGDTNAITAQRKATLNRAGDPESRLEAFDALAGLSNGIPVKLLHQLVANDRLLRRGALEALITRSEDATADVLLESFETMSPIEKQQAVGVLVTRRKFADKLLNAIEDRQVERRDVSAFALQQLRSWRDDSLQRRVADIWESDSSALKKSEELNRLTQRMSPEYLSHGSPSAGRLVFHNTCSKCHTLFGEGGTIAPDLTGSGRRKVDYVLRNLVDPSAEIDEAYRLTTVISTDGRLLTGFIVKQDDTWLEIRTQDARIRMRMKDVDELTTSRTSMMPDGMLQTFSDEQIRDLLVYLASDSQVPLPANNNAGRPPF